jgi:hypothetical protein
MSEDKDVLPLRQAIVAEREAESRIVRLRGYIRRSPSMREDLRRWHERDAEAKELIAKFLAGDYVVITKDRYEELKAAKKE